MGAYILSVGSFKMKLQAGKQVRRYQNDLHVHLDELALYKIIATVKHAAQAGLVHLVALYAEHQAEKLKLELNEYPPHSLFCDCKEVCQPKRWVFEPRRNLKKGI